MWRGVARHRPDGPDRLPTLQGGVAAAELRKGLATTPLSTSEGSRTSGTYIKLLENHRK